MPVHIEYKLNIEGGNLVLSSTETNWLKQFLNLQFLMYNMKFEVRIYSALLLNLFFSVWFIWCLYFIITIKSQIIQTYYIERALILWLNATCDKTKMLICHRLSDQNILTLPRIHAEFSNNNTSPISTVTSVTHNTCCTTSHNSLLSAWFEMWLVNTRVLVSWFQIREALLLKKCVMFLFFIFKGKTTNWKNTITIYSI